MYVCIVREREYMPTIYIPYIYYYICNDMCVCLKYKGHKQNSVCGSITMKHGDCIDLLVIIVGSKDDPISMLWG